MRTLARTAGLILLAAAAGCHPPPGALFAEEPSRIDVDWGRTHQTIVGFGGTMGWIHPHPQRRKEVFDLLFTKLGVSVLRIRALGGEGGDEKSIEPVNDNADPKTFDWPKFKIRETEAKNAAIISAAQARGVRTVIATSWSPPGWMKTTGLRAGGGTLEGANIDEFAEAWAAYVIGMRREFRIAVPYISIQNEPDLTYYYPTCRFDPKPYARARAAVAARLAKEGLATKVIGPDTCRIYHVADYVDEMEKLSPSPGEPVLTHLYDLGISYGRADRDPARWRKARNYCRKLRRPLWFMEAANYLSYGVDKGSWEEALVWARKIHHALVEGDCEAVCYWALYFDKLGESLVYAEKDGAEKFTITPKFYTSMNWFRYVRPGMKRCTASSGEKRLLVSAFRKPPRNEAATDRRTVVIVNVSKDAVTAAPPPAPEGYGWEAFRTTRALKCESIGRPENALRLPAESVTTLVLRATVRR